MKQVGKRGLLRCRDSKSGGKPLFLTCSVPHLLARLCCAFASGTRSITVRFVATRYFAAAVLICAAVTFSNGVSRELICCGLSRKSASADSKCILPKLDSSWL